MVLREDYALNDQVTHTDMNAIGAAVNGATASIAGKYTKPSGGIPATDLAPGAVGSAGTTLGAKFLDPMSSSPYPVSDVTTFTPQTSTAPAWIGQYYPWNTLAARFRYGGILSASGSAGYNNINGATSGTAVTGWEMEFYVTGSKFALHYETYGANDYRVFVDGKPMNAAWPHLPNTTGQYFMVFEFATARLRKVRILMGNLGFVQMLTPTDGQIWPAEPRFKMAVITDSLYHGGTSVAGVNTACTTAGQIAMLMGWEVWNLAQGGTGYSNPGNGTTTGPGPNGVNYYGAASRLAALAAIPAMDLVVVAGGANDGDLTTYPVVGTVARANAVWNAVKAARPNTPLVVCGVESGVYPSISADMDTLNTALKNAANANPNVTAYIDERQNPSQWVNGTGDESSIVGDGNADIFRSGTDHVHPTPEGWEYRGRRLKAALAPVRIPA